MPGWALIEIGGQLGHGLDGNAGVDHEDARNRGRQRQRRKILLRRIVQFPVETAVDRQARHGGQKDGVSIRWSRGDEGGSDGFAAAGLVFHHHRLPESAGEPGADQAGHCVGGAASGEGNDDPDGLDGKVGGVGKGQSGCHGNGCGAQHGCELHGECLEAGKGSSIESPVSSGTRGCGDGWGRNGARSSWRAGPGLLLRASG